MIGGQNFGTNEYVEVSEGENKTMLGQEQFDWFINELQSFADFSFVFWVSTIPWVIDEEKWGAFKEERTVIGMCILKYMHKNAY